MKSLSRINLVNGKILHDQEYAIRPSSSRGMRRRSRTQLSINPHSQNRTHDAGIMSS